MKPNLYLLILAFLLQPFWSEAQTTYLPLHSPEEHLLERIEVKSGSISPYFFEFRPVSRKEAIDYIEDQRVNILHGDLSLTAQDQFQIQRAKSISSEWSETADGLDAAIPSKKPILRYFYQVQPDMIHVHTDDFFLVVNPVVYTEAIKEKDIDKIGYINMRGIELRGRILNKVGFYTLMADDQERPFSYVQSFEQQFRTYPGMTFYGRSKKTGNYDFFMAKGYLDVPLLNDHVNVTFGYDQNFSGVGLRSLINSDYAPPATFLRLRGYWQKWGYQSLFLQLTADYANMYGSHRLEQKYAAIHQLGYQARPWLNIGLFESSVFAGTDNLKATDLVPVIGYQTLARSLGAQQKTALGLWFKAIALRHFQFYGQAYLDRLDLSKIGDKNWWGNQFAVQLGGKYFDAFTVSNLDLQGELNYVRPFTYMSSGDDADYTHFNQPLAHPFGAGFAEITGRIDYTPINKFYVQARASYSLRGSESSATESSGINIMKNEDARVGNTVEGWIPGANRKALYLNLNLAYELRPNLFLEGGLTNWQWQVSGAKSNTFGLYGGLRWNISRKEYDSY